MSDTEFQGEDQGAESMQRVAVTGATGFVGQAVVRTLLGEGRTVRALVRDVQAAAKKLPADLVENENLEIVDGTAVFERVAPEGVDRATGTMTSTIRLGDTERDAERPLATADARAAALEGCDAVIHLVGIIREAPGGQTFRRVHVEMTRRVIEACKAAQVDRLIHMSALGVSESGKTAYLKTKGEAEKLVRSSGLDWTIFRPGLIHGPGGEFTQMCAQWVRGAIAPWLFVPYFTKLQNPDGKWMPPPGPTDPDVQPVAVEDVAGAFSAALDREASIGEVYNLVGPDVMSYPDMIEVFKDAVPGAKEKIQSLGLPGVPMALKAKAASFVGLRDMLPFDYGMAIMGASDSTGETDKAREHLSFEPRRFAPALKGYADQL